MIGARIANAARDAQQRFNLRSNYARKGESPAHAPEIANHSTAMLAAFDICVNGNAAVSHGTRSRIIVVEPDN